ncbi:hypothetical protein HMPREF1978_00817 [Actinomyces graevenitzii F0530]|uniref:Uncharacterized protein n=1 Tax=Actinomyces graevenitzii F0530 TaxID=1321817 RepID=U1PLB0_9ACTO|nr:hypothetical protein [Actinomyces graevenitzii]ERH17045.1 hypothetical protein HMPREF1978_00817 [Actinomyces graevenitzii F0530]
METDPGASLDRLIAALRQYQVASAAGETSSAALAAKRQLTQAFADCEQALVDPAEISKALAIGTAGQAEQKARKSSGAESDTPKRVSHKKTAADGPDPVPYFNDGTNTSAFICIVYVAWIGFFYFCGLMVYNEVFKRTNSFEALDTGPQWWLLGLVRVAEFGLLGGTMLLLTFICGFIVREIRPHFAYPLVALVAMLLVWLTFDYEGNQRLLEDISYELIRLSIVKLDPITEKYFSVLYPPQVVSLSMLMQLSALGALIGLWLRRRYDSIDHPMSKLVAALSKLVAGLKSVFSLHG